MEWGGVLRTSDGHFCPQLCRYLAGNLPPLSHIPTNALQGRNKLGAAGLLQVGAFNGDDPRGWSIWVAYAALVPSAEDLQVKAGDDAAAASWHDVTSLPPLAFNHKTILRAALRHGLMQTQQQQHIAIFAWKPAANAMLCAQVP